MSYEQDYFHLSQFSLARFKLISFSVIFFGLLTIGLSYAADKFTSKLSQATGTIWGVIDGPLAGIFIAGFFIPFCNAAVR